MDIVKDFLLIFIIFTIVFQYVKLYRLMSAQRLFFINTLKHDLRVSLLAQIRGLEFLKNCIVSESTSELLNELDVSSKYSLDMINMLLKVYKHDNDEIILDSRSFNFSELANLLINNLSSSFLEKNIKIIYNSKDYIKMFADKNCIEKIMEILISKAIISANKNSSIYIDAISNEDFFRISINYAGKPITDEEKRRMFEKKPKFSTVGYGIKLLICKKFIDFHDGEILVEDNRNNTHSFILTIPQKQKNNIQKHYKKLKIEEYLCNNLYKNNKITRNI